MLLSRNEKHLNICTNNRKKKDLQQRIGFELKCCNICLRKQHYLYDPLFNLQMLFQKRVEFSDNVILWFKFLQRVGLQSVAPQNGDECLVDWWDKIIDGVRKPLKKSLLRVSHLIQLECLCSLVRISIFGVLPGLEAFHSSLPSCRC